ncbi:hypothetical protein RND81_03G149300 [Saponaria officinalis]|uniref:Uncharacterized protein n=1 Tax=Saponaria officinalis TaxID=3572 RepID=A0AAW1M7Q8_SAPOF
MASSGTPKLKKKIENSIKHQSADAKSKSIQQKHAKSEGKTIAPTTPVKKREKKVYSLPGQKHDPPEEREPVRIFYESLSKQLPTSEMAEFWMMEHGMLSPEKARKALEKKLRKQKQTRTGTPVKAPPPSRKPESSIKQNLSSKNVDVKAKRKIVNDDDDEVIRNQKRRKA